MSINITYIFKYDPNKPIIGHVEINNGLYPYTEIVKEDEPEQLDLWGNPL
jgi:hypothetical protein